MKYNKNDSSMRFAPFYAILSALFAGCAAQPPVVTQSAMDRTLSAAVPGDVVQIPDLDIAKLPTLPIQKTDAHGPQFLFSDKPEYFRTGDGISLQEDVHAGVVRLYVYHCPDPSAAEKTISCVIENRGTLPLTLKFLRYAFPKPSYDYGHQAKLALMDYFNQHAGPAPRVISPGGRAVLDPAMDKVVVKKDILVHGLYEFQIDQPARVTVFEKTVGQNSLGVIDTLPKLPHILPGKHESGAGRGAFFVSDYDVTMDKPLDVSAGPQVMMIADGKLDPWVQGKDGISGMQGADNQNKGNYGVMYKVHLKLANTHGKAVAAVLINSRGTGDLCKYTEGAAWVKGIGAVALPTKQSRTAGPPEAVILQKFEVSKEAQEIEFEWSPPGASCLPTPIVFVPFNP